MSNRLLALAATAIAASFCFAPAAAAKYYSDQTNFEEVSAVLADYRWSDDRIDSCIFKEDGVANRYYVWTKLAVQNWRQALKEYTGDSQAWQITARHVDTEHEMQNCDVKIYIYDTYKDFPDYPAQSGAYTSVKYAGDDITASVYLSPFILHGDGETEIDLPSYAFRNSAVHEIGHVLGLGHMESQKGYLMSPQFDFWEQSDQMPITTLELEALAGVYGSNGFG